MDPFPHRLSVTASARLARLLRVVLVIACVCYAVSVLPGVRAQAGYSQLWEVGFANVVALGAASLVLLRAIADRRRRLAWSFLAAGLGSYALGALYFSLFLQPLTDMPFPSVADGMWLVFYPGAFVAVLLLAKQELQNRPDGGRAVTPLDGLIVGLTLAALSAAFVFDRITAGAGGTPIAIATNFAYPVGDLVLLVLVGSVLAILGWSADLRWRLLALGVLAFAIADTWYLLQIAAETYTPGSPVDATWTVGQLLIGLAAWCRPSKASAPRDAGISAFLLPALSGAAAVIVLVGGAFLSLSIVGVLLAAAAVVLVFVRLALALRQAPFLAESRKQARTDELTGLPNRRAFYETLADAGTSSGQTSAQTSTVLLLGSASWLLRSLDLNVPRLQFPPRVVLWGVAALVAFGVARNLPIPGHDFLNSAVY